MSTKVEQLTKHKRRGVGLSINLYEAETRDSEVVKLYKQLVKFIYLQAAVLMGVRLFYNWKPLRHFMLVFTMGTLGVIWVCFFYTKFVHIRNGDNMRVLEVFAVYGIAISCTFKSLNYLWKRNKVLALLTFMLKICRQNSAGRRADILKDYFRKCLSLLKTVTVCFLANISLYIATPFVSYVVKQELIALVPIEFPYVDQSTIFGYLLANLMMGINGILACSGTLFCCSLYILLIFNFNAQVDLIGDDFNSLDKMWTDRKQSLQNKREFLRDICVRCQDIDRYIAEIKEIFDLQMFVFFCGAYCSQIICLFEIAKNNWIPGYAIALLMFEEIMFYCYLGTEKNGTNQKLCYFICDTNWYEYDLQSQQKIKMVLHSCQNSSELNIGPLAPMNLATGVEIIKSIYTYFTILKELL